MPSRRQRRAGSACPLSLTYTEKMGDTGPDTGVVDEEKRVEQELAKQTSGSKTTRAMFMLWVGQKTSWDK